MSALLPLLSFLLVMVVGEGRKLLSGKEMTMMVPNPMADVMAYWKTAHPNSPIPSAILDLLTPPSVNQKKELLFLTSGNGAKGADEKSSILKLNPKLDQAKKKFSPYNYDNPADGYDRVYYDGDSDKHMFFNYEAVKIKMKNLDLYWYSGANEINNKPELDLSNKKLSRHNNGNPSHGHDHILLDKTKLLRYIYSNPANKHVRLHYDGHSDNHMVFNTESMKLKKGFSYLYQFNGVRGIDQKPELNLAKKKFSCYVYGNLANSHHVYYDGRSDKYMVLNYEAKKLKNKNSDLCQHSEANGIDKKHKLNLSKKKFSRYIYGNLADGHHHVHLATKKFSHYIYSNPTVGRHGHNDKYMVPNYEAMELKKKNSDLYQHSEVNGIDKKPKLKLVKKKFSRYIYDNLEDGHGRVHLARKKLSHYYTYSNLEDGHEHFNHHGHSENHIVFNKKATKLRKENSNWYYYSGVKELDKKHKPDLANKKFAHYIYSTPANEQPFL